MSLANSENKRAWDNLLCNYASRGILVWLSSIHQQGGNIFCKDDDGKSLLHLASEKGRIDCVRYLCEQGLNIDKQDDSKFTALHYAAVNGHLKCVQYLIDHGADTELKTSMGNTALEIASNEVFEYLKNLDENKKLQGLIDIDNQLEIMEF